MMGSEEAADSELEDFVKTGRKIKVKAMSDTISMVVGDQLKPAKNGLFLNCLILSRVYSGSYLRYQTRCLLILKLDLEHVQSGYVLNFYLFK